MPLLFKCVECGEYTLEERRCPRCGGAVRNPHPAKYSPLDKYGAYRRAAKKRARASDAVENRQSSLKGQRRPM